MTDQQDEIRSSLREFFTPTQPITLPDLLTGRMDVLAQVYEDVLLPSQHVLLYGDRGRWEDLNSSCRIGAIRRNGRFSIGGNCGVLRHD